MRRRARRWAAAHRFPLRRELLVEHHRLPFARLGSLSNLLIPAVDELSTEVIDIGMGLRMELDLHSSAQRAIAYRLSDENELAVVRDCLRAGDTVIDIGANIGLYSLVSSQAVGPKGLVHAFEPNPKTADVLERNLALNQAFNVTVHRTAVSDEDGTATLRTPDTREPGLATITGAGAAIAQVRTIRLDTFAEGAGLERVALLKIDAEGAEAEILRGGEESLATRVRCVLFEVLEGSTLAQEVLVAHGFSLRVVQPGSSDELTRPCEPGDSFAYANILATR